MLQPYRQLVIIRNNLKMPINQGRPDFFSRGPNFIKKLYCGPQKFFFCSFSIKFDINNVNFRCFPYKIVSK